MSFQVNIKNSKNSFTANEGELIIDAALRQGINFPHSCVKGFCGACKGVLIDGNIEYKKEPKKLERIDPDEMIDGLSLFCCCSATSDLLIDIEIVNELNNIIPNIYPSKIVSKELLAKDVARLYLKIPDNDVLNFLPGQYIDILLKDGKKRSFSLANSPENNHLLELHIRHVEGGLFTERLFKNINENELLRIEGPHGSFFYREESNRPIIFMAGGTGFAPVKSIIEHLIYKNIELPIYLYWGVRTNDDLYLYDLVREWCVKYNNINFTPVLSDPSVKNWDGKKGYVHNIICEDFENLNDYDIYACGPPIMIESGENKFKKQGLKEDRFFYDSFDYAAD